MDTLLNDIRYAARRLMRAPGFTFVAVLTLALGIGANTAIFSVVNGVLLRALPYPDSGRLVRVWSWFEDNRNSTSPLDYLDLQEENRSLSGLAAFHFAWRNLTGDGSEPERLRTINGTANIFSVVGVQPKLGRGLVAGDDEAGAAPVVVLNEGFWMRRFGGDPKIVGKPILLDGRSHTVVGVVADGTGFPSDVDAWTPYVIPAEDREPPARGKRFIQMVGRLRPGVTLEAANADLGAIARRIEQQYPESNTGLQARAFDLRDEMVGGLRTPLLVLLGAVAFVTLIACANVANLLLVRAAGRETELAVRTALGAGRARVMRQLVTESIVLALVGGGAGLAMAAWGLEAFKRLAPQGMPRMSEVTMDGRVLLFTFGIALLTGVVVGLVPAFGATRPDLAQTLREGARGSRTRPGSHRTRRALVVSEMALAVLLLAGAGLLIRSFAALSDEDPGFRAEKVATFTLSLPEGKYSTPERRRAFVREFMERLQRLPGSRGAGGVSMLPMSYGSFGLSFTIVGDPAPTPGQEPGTGFNGATPGYFATMAIPVKKGREFTPADREGAPQVAIVNEAFARRHFPGRDPIGRRIRLDGPVTPLGEPEIVGVIGNIRQAGLANEDVPTLYMPYDQAPDFVLQQVGVVVRTAGEPLQLAGAIKRELREVDADMPLVGLTTFEERIAGTIAQPRFYTTLLTVFAAVALVLSAIGIYGVMAYAVALRTSEIGIRIALGATARHVLGQVLREGMSVAAIGVGIGAVAALWLTGALRGLLYGVSATDPITFAVVSAVLLGVALLACWIPARRATRVDPLVAMKAE